MFWLVALEFNSPVNTIEVSLSCSVNEVNTRTQELIHLDPHQALNTKVKERQNTIKQPKDEQMANHTIPGQTYSSKRLTSTCSQSFTRN